jgi:soluble lytic murein transglycosylase-like protein
VTLRELTDAAKAEADKQGLDRDFVSAIISAESSWNPWVVRHEPLYTYLYCPRECASKFGIPSATTETFMQKTSFGLMQVMGAVAREAGFDRWLTELLQPEIGLQYGCMHLKKQLARYGGDEMKAAASYNHGSAQMTSGRLFVNQWYVDRVHAKLLELRRLS